MVHLSAISILCPILFREFVSTYHKTYASDAEFDTRREIFCDNYEFINAHNAKNDVSYKLDINEFADLTLDEFQAIYTPSPISMDSTNNVYDETDYDANSGGKKPLPLEFDWRTDHHVSEVKNQAQCGSCWSFATTGSIEAHYSVYKGEKVSLSEQELVDCSYMYGNLGCSGGMVDRAYRYAKRFGLSSEKSYAYQASNHLCKFKTMSSGANKTFITGWQYVGPFNETRLTETLYNVGPIAVAIDASGDGFRFYKSGVFDNCGYQLNHAVLLVGYGVENGQDYYIIKNSWGATYGDKGYIKISRGKHLMGTCGVATIPIYPQVV